MRYLGIDFGSKRVGLALSDESCTLAFPYKVLTHDRGLLAAVDEVIRDQKVKLVVMGESKDFSGKDNPIASLADEFKKALEKLTHKKVEYEQEFLTSVQAGRPQGRRQDGSRGTGARAEQRKTNEMLDASAAAIILQSYLDRRRTTIV
ncbi:MAG: Holliday junction resolvase RuvX [bacterium]|nr:Holliday junction resolvase RuvX [bacterium]